MGKTNWVILALGLGACLALSLMMKQALVIKEDAKRDPVVKAIHEVFGNRLEGRPQFVVEARQGRKVGVLTIRPRLNHASRHLANTLGTFAWRQSTPGRFDALEVVALQEDRPDQRFPVARPPMMGRFTPGRQGPRSLPRGSTPGRRVAPPPPAPPRSAPPRPATPPPATPPAAPRPGRVK